MMNYDLFMQNTVRSIAEKGGQKPSLLLHSCCAPCSSACIERLWPHFNITVFFYNPNIMPKEEYEKRKNEQIKLVNLLNTATYTDVFPATATDVLSAHTDSAHTIGNNSCSIKFIDGDYDNETFCVPLKGLEHEKEGGLRCQTCIALRLFRTAQTAKAHNFDWFCSTLTISPHKDAVFINETGKKLEVSCGISFLQSDFKKRGGYLRSIELSKQFGLYRQNYCGCTIAEKEVNL
jgi:predicted adenine nucleotide alpha hydrolase (AANH) superfamily ATPase